MQFTTIGNTGLTVSVAGLGCGGNSRLGLGAGKSEAECVQLVREARDLGITFFDTAESYGTEHILGNALAPHERPDVVISTKSRISDGQTAYSAAQVVDNLDGSLKRLRTDYVDVFLLHGVPPSAYERARDVYAPALQREQAKGKIRHLGLSETSPRDPDQTMLQRALQDDVWRVYMLAFHMMNQGARRDLFPHTKTNGVGTLAMFVVRNIFSRPAVLTETMQRLAAEGLIPRDLANSRDPLGFLMRDGGAASLTDAAYRFARHERGCDVVLFGTSHVDHMRANVASILAPPLADPAVEKLYTLFGHLRGVGLDLPDRVQSNS
jgi:aryl-alcohol dehydrogenase-like predicted oxidoreductase